MSETLPQKKEGFFSVKPDRNILTAAKGGSIVFVGNLFEYGSRFIIAFLTARLLGSEQLGLLNLSLSVVYIASSLALLGLPPAIVRYVSLFSSRQDTDKVWGTLQVGLGLGAIAGVLAGIGMFVLANPIATQLFHEARLIPLLRIISVVVPFLAMNEVIAAATQGFKRMQYTVISQKISQPLSRLVLIIVLAIIFGLTAKKALIVFNVATMIAFAMLLYFLNGLFPLNRSLRTARRDVGPVLRFALPLYLSNLIRTFRGRIQTLLMGTLNTTANVGIFSTANQVNLVGTMFNQAVVIASAPIVSELYEQGDHELLRRFYQTVTKWVFTLNLPLFLIMMLFPKSILSIFGDSFVAGATALSILACANLVNTSTGICATVLSMTGNTSIVLTNSLVTFVLTLGLNALLIPRWDLMGAAIATLIVVAFTNMLCLVETFVLFRSFPYNRGFVKPITAGVTGLVAVWGVHLLFPPTAHLIYTAICITVLLTGYGGVILLLGFSPEDRMVLNRIRQRIQALLSK
ncbi:MAG: hypothetical protein DRI81_02555 [Chloroflexi bacterium]|nr:MAG: hypothetical protein DRI81_02555 [Chloroflexota bacterium]